MCEVVRMRARVASRVYGGRRMPATLPAALRCTADGEWSVTHTCLGFSPLCQLLDAVAPPLAGPKARSAGEARTKIATRISVGFYALFSLPFF